MPSVHDREEARSSLNIAWYVLHIFNICLTNKHFHMNFVCIVLHFKIIMDVRARLWIVCYCCCFSSSPLLLIFLGIFCRLLPSHVSRQDIGLLSGTKTLSTNAYHIILLSLTHIIWLYIAKKRETQHYCGTSLITLLYEISSHIETLIVFEKCKVTQRLVS